MDGRQVRLDNDETNRKPIKRKNSVEEKVKLIDLHERTSATEEEKFDVDLPRKSSKDKVLSPRFFVRSASGDKNNNPATDTKKIDFTKL